MSATLIDPLVSTAWLADHLDAPDVRIVDASWFMPGTPRDPKEEFEAGHIPGAVFFDIDEISDETSPLPHMLASGVKFASRVRKLGLGDGARIVVYDSTGILPAARVWWNFRVMGHEDVVVLDGGLPKWVAEGRPLEDGPAAPQERHFTPRLQADLVRSFDQIKRNLETGREQVIDARAALQRRGSRAPRRPQERPHPRLAQHSAGGDPGGRRDHAARRAAEDRLRRRRRRHRKANRHDLRLGHHRLGGVAGPAPPRQAPRGGLRRLVDRMGRPRRRAGGNRSGCVKTLKITHSIYTILN